jgi:hypothetical protein
MNGNKASFNLSRICSSNIGHRNQTNMVQNDFICDSISIIPTVPDSKVKANIFITTLLKFEISFSQIKFEKLIQL